MQFCELTFGEIVDMICKYDLRDQKWQPYCKLWNFYCMGCFCNNLDFLLFANEEHQWTHLTNFNNMELKWRYTYVFTLLPWLLLWPSRKDPLEVRNWVFCLSLSLFFCSFIVNSLYPISVIIVPGLCVCVCFTVIFLCWYKWFNHDDLSLQLYTAPPPRWYNLVDTFQ